MSVMLKYLKINLEANKWHEVLSACSFDNSFWYTVDCILLYWISSSWTVWWLVCHSRMQKYLRKIIMKFVKMTKSLFCKILIGKDVTSVLPQHINKLKIDRMWKAVLKSYVSNFGESKILLLIKQRLWGIFNLSVDYKKWSFQSNWWTLSRLSFLVINLMWYMPV